jgi:hypothetical protein
VEEILGPASSGAECAILHIVCPFSLSLLILFPSGDIFKIDGSLSSFQVSQAFILIAIFIFLFGIW